MGRGSSGASPTRVICALPTRLVAAERSFCKSQLRYRGHCPSRLLPNCRNEYRMISVRRVVTVLLLALLVVQLGPACEFGNAAVMDSMQCCQSECPVRSSQMPANCCRISASSDKAKPVIGTAPQPSLVYMVGHLASVALYKISDPSLVTYRSVAPPPQRMRLSLFCSRQI